MRTEFWEIGGAIWTDGRRPEVRIAPPISKNEVCIYRCVRARLTAYTLLLGKLKPATTLEKTILKPFYPFWSMRRGWITIELSLSLFWEIAYVPSYGSEQRQELKKLAKATLLILFSIERIARSKLILIPWNHKRKSKIFINNRFTPHVLVNMWGQFTPYALTNT